MAAFLERLGLFPRAPDPRPLGVIAADIEDELAFHLEASTRALIEEGLEDEAARAEALRRFGDVDRIRRECARTLMGERIVLQRIQFVLTAALLAAVVFLVLASRETNARAAVERERSLALLAQIEARLVQGEARLVEERRHAASEPALQPPPVIDRLPVLGQSAEESPAGAYLAANGTRTDLGTARESWSEAFNEQHGSWRHGLRIAERLAALSGSQGAEILVQVWNELSVEHREQVMKPFVFDGGHPHALEVLELGFEDSVHSVRERAVLYLQTYAWQDLWQGDGQGDRWLAQWRDRPVGEVLRENAERWARAYAECAQEREQIAGGRVEHLLEGIEHVRPETLAKAGVDLRGILVEAGVCAIAPARLGGLPAAQRAIAERVRSWCQP